MLGFIQSFLAATCFFIGCLLLVALHYQVAIFGGKQSSRHVRREQRTDVSFTAAELAYVKYGEGRKEVVHRRDERYLQLIRLQTSRPTPRRVNGIDEYSPGQHEKMVEQRLNRKRNGFFVECGANNGIFQSNTLYLERKYNWTGLLVEASPTLVKKLLYSYRQAYIYGGCLSPYLRPAILQFKSAGCCGGLTDHLTSSQEHVIISNRQISSIDLVQCYPLGDLMAAIGINHIDYMALDVHGAELPILKTIDFHELRIDLMTIECYDRNETVRRQMAEEISELFKETGLYKEVNITSGDLIVERLNITSTTD